MADVIIKIDELKEKVAHKLVQAGLSKKESSIVADVLVHSDMRGVRSHGTIRLEHYINRIKHNGINLNSSYDFKMMAKSCAVLDVEGGMGHYGMYKATKEALKLVKDTGIFTVSIQNASHCGALSYYIDMALKENIVTMAFVNVDTCVVPYGGKVRYFGTNPIAFGFPGVKHQILIDMATSEVAFGKIYAARESNSDIPITWGVDEKGVPTTNPHKVVAVLPMSGYKGTALATAVEGFTGFFTGAFGPHIVKMYREIDKFRNTGGFLFFMDPKIFGGGDIYFQSTDKLFEELKNIPLAPGIKEMLVAGEPEDRRYQESLKNGVIIYDTVSQFLNDSVAKNSRG